jgi:uncharacterized protein (DUF1778 family)
MEKKKQEHLHVKVGPDFKLNIKEAADNNNQTVSQYVRHVLTSAVKRDIRKHLSL